MQQLSSLQSSLLGAVERFRKKYESFDEAYSSYTAQYGEASVKVYEPFRINGTIDPVIIILGRTTPLFYRDSKRILSGSLNTAHIEPGNVYILGRHTDPESKLVLWSPAGETEIEQYDTRVRIIPSRIHAAVFALDGGDVFFSDLGSTSGSILAGETAKPEPFITLYATPKVGVNRVPLEPKYGQVKPAR